MRRTRICIALMIVAPWLVACASTEPQKQKVAPAPATAPAPQTTGPLPPLPRPQPLIRSRPGPQKASTRTKPQLVTFTARFDIDRLPGGKMFQGSILYLDDGRQLVASYRPMKAYFEFVDRRVVVSGHHYSPPREAQQIMADHFSIKSMKLAPGQPPYPSKPTRLPRPTLVRKRSELEARHGRWVTLVGKLASGQKRANDSWCDATLKLADGTPVGTEMYIGSFNSEWRPLMGKQVSVTGKLSVKQEGTQKRLTILGRTAICAGVVVGCGMDR